MSARAAWRLESFGLTDVYDYLAGKADWLANGLPTEGPGAATPRIGAATMRDVPTCRADEPLASVQERLSASAWDTCVVVNDARVVLGRLCLADLDDPSAQTAEEAMEIGPTTYRPNEAVVDAARQLAERGVRDVLVTTSEGVLIGLFRPAGV